MQHFANNPDAPQSLDCVLIGENVVTVQYKLITENEIQAKTYCQDFNSYEGAYNFITNYLKGSIDE